MEKELKKDFKIIISRFIIAFFYSFYFIFYILFIKELSSPIKNVSFFSILSIIFYLILIYYTFDNFMSYILNKLWGIDKNGKM